MTMKERYSAPAAETFEVQTEGMVCLSGYGETGRAGADSDYNNYDDDF